MTSIPNRHLFEGNSFDEIFRDLLVSLNDSPQHMCSPRGSKIKENLAVTLVLRNPRARLLTPEARATNYGFGVGEFLWYWQGKNDLGTMTYYNKRMKDFSDDGETLNSAYGKRMLKDQYEFLIGGYEGDGSTGSQWEACINTLRTDPDSRRALLLINLPQDNIRASLDHRGSKDVPCTLSLQFFIRDGRLDLHTHMRSNDVIWGLTYDLFSFTLFQECMLSRLKLYYPELLLGTYYHTAGSLHLYERHFKQAEDISKEYWDMNAFKEPMLPISGINDLNLLCDFESRLRTGVIDHIETDRFVGGLRWMAEQLNEHRRKRDEEPRKSQS